MTQQSSTTRIAKNTLLLYFRQILILLVSLYTVRVVLNTLGAADYGIYNVVAGVVTMFSFLSGAMATASQRYFSFELGRGDTQKLSKTFSVTLCIYILLILIIVFFAETIGLWFVNHKLKIATERMVAAKWIYQASILGFVVTLITTPYMASIIAHENMNVYAYVSIVEVTLKLAIVFLLKILPFDKLIVYGVLLFVVSFINTALYRTYCKKHYAECKFKPVWDKAMFREIIGFTGWNLFGNLSGVLKSQGVSILLNQFFGPIVSASRTIALQVNSAVNSFSQNFSMAVKPQIIKDYAQKKYDDLFILVFRTCKFTFFLMLIFTVPLILNIEFVLAIWLVNVQEHTVMFTILILIESLVESMSYPMSTANQATGKVKYYQLTLSSLGLLNLPVDYVLLKLGYSANCVFVVGIVIITLITIPRFLFMYQIPKFSIKKCFQKVIFPILIIVASVIAIFSVLKFQATNFITFFLNVIIEVLIVAGLIFLIGFSKNEKRELFFFLKNRLKRGK